MKSHEVANILLNKPNVALVTLSFRTTDDKHWMGGKTVFREVNSVVWTNHEHFIDSIGFDNDCHGRECVILK